MWLLYMIKIMCLATMNSLTRPVNVSPLTLRRHKNIAVNIFCIGTENFEFPSYLNVSSICKNFRSYCMWTVYINCIPNCCHSKIHALAAWWKQWQCNATVSLLKICMRLLHTLNLCYYQHVILNCMKATLTVFGGRM